MRVNVYTDEITDRIEIVQRDGRVGVRFYLELPVTVPTNHGVTIHRGGFRHPGGEDDSAAVTFWSNGNQVLLHVLKKAVGILENHPPLNVEGTHLV